MRKRRVYVGGLPAGITAEDLQNRFKSFGKIDSVCLAKDQFENGERCRGFGFFDLETSDEQWKRCLNTYNGTIWQGSRVKLEEARPSRLQTVLEEAKEVSKGKRLRKLAIRHSKDMSLVDDKNVEGRKGWKRGRFGRAIAEMTLRRPDGKLVVVDPLHYKNNLEKLFGSVKPLPIAQLQWEYYSEESPLKKKHKKNTIQTEGKSDIFGESSSSDEDTKADKDIEQIDDNNEHLSDGESVSSVGKSEHERVTSVADDSIESFKELDQSESQHPATVAEEDHPKPLWESLVGDSGSFSLAAKIGLPPVEVKEATSTMPTFISKSEEPCVATLKSISPQDVLTDWSVLTGPGALSLVPLPRAEYMALWKSRRSELKYDCKSQLKQAKKMQQRKRSRM